MDELLPFLLHLLGEFLVGELVGLADVGAALLAVFVHLNIIREVVDGWLINEG